MGALDAVRLKPGGMTANFQVIVEPEDGVFVTYVPALDFASTFGPTREVALARTRELIVGHLEAARKEGIPVDVPAAEQRRELVDLSISA
jgi:predicted RNase H-like HicB family nuclease